MFVSKAPLPLEELNREIATLAEPTSSRLLSLQGETLLSPSPYSSPYPHPSPYRCVPHSSTSPPHSADTLHSFILHCIQQVAPRSSLPRLQSTNPETQQYTRFNCPCPCRDPYSNYPSPGPKRTLFSPTRERLIRRWTGGGVRNQISDIVCFLASRKTSIRNVHRDSTPRMARPPLTS